MVLNTFSIVARNPNTGEFGVAVTTAAPAVGALAPHAKAGVGAVSTQSFVSVPLGRKAIMLVELGIRMDLAIKILLEQDPNREYRQIIGIDNHVVYGFTGEKCDVWAGHLIKNDFAVAGNMLANGEVIDAVAEAYIGGSDMDFGLRLLRALKAGEEKGGDKRGKQSAALIIASNNPKWYHNLRVDDNPNPLDELIRIYTLTKKTIEEFEKKYGDLMKIIEL